MTQDDVKQKDSEATEPGISGFRFFTRVFFGRKVAVVGAFIILLLIVSALFAPFIAPYDPDQPDAKNVLAQPSAEHLLGTDNLGRDILSRIIYGSRVSIQISIIAIVVAAGLGMTLGIVAGYFGGWLNMIIMRFIDALMAIPVLVLALVITAALGGGAKNVMIALGIALTPIYCRLMCGQVLSIKENDYVTAAQVTGASHLRVMISHIAPNCFPVLIVVLTINLGVAILAEAGLSFLGIGIKPPQATWGTMVNSGFRYLSSNPLMSFAPGFCIMLVVWAFNMVGDGLRDALDPRLRGSV